MAKTMSAISRKFQYPENRCAWPEIFAAALNGMTTVSIHPELLASGPHCKRELKKGGFLLDDLGEDGYWIEWKNHNRK